MTSTFTCTHCGAPLPTPTSTCPRCLLALGARTPAPGAPASPPHAVPASLDELAPLFPGLELESILGVGGMGTVYKARQRDLDRHVALKILSPACTQDPTFAERFEREARVLARISHPNVVQIFDAGRSGERYWLMMEYVDGVNLRKLIEEREISPRESLSIVTQVCDALQYAHDEGVVHRDIKPENILVDRSGKVKIADFGLAKLVERETGRVTLTRSDQAMGTPQYMAPEQIRKPLAVDHRADIYSLGVVLYELLTGELPMGNFPLPSDRVGIDVRLDEVVLKTLEREPERRYQHASEVKLDVERASSAAVASSSTPSPDPAPATPSATSTSSTVPSSGPACRDRRQAKHAARVQQRSGRGRGLSWVFAGLGCLFLLVGSLLALLFLGVTRMNARRNKMFAEQQRATIEASQPRPLEILPVPPPPSEDGWGSPTLLAPHETLLERRDRHELLAAAGRVTSTLSASLRGLSDGLDSRELAELQTWLSSLRQRYLDLERAHILTETQAADGIHIELEPFPDEIIELENEFRSGLARRIPEADLKEFDFQVLALRAFPFGWSRTRLDLRRTLDGWGWNERVYDDAGDLIYQSEREDAELPERLRHFVSDTSGAPDGER